MYNECNTQGIRCTPLGTPPFSIIEPWRGESVATLNSVVGRGTPGRTVCIKIGCAGEEFCTTVDGCGWWRIDHDFSLPRGSHTIYAAQFIECQREGQMVRRTECEPFSLPFRVETSILPAPTITFPENGSVITNPLLTVQGTAIANNIVTVCLDGMCAGTRAMPDGRFAISFPVPLTPGAHIVTAIQEDPFTCMTSLVAASEFTLVSQS